MTTIVVVCHPIHLLIFKVYTSHKLFLIEHNFGKFCILGVEFDHDMDACNPKAQINLYLLCAHFIPGDDQYMFLFFFTLMNHVNDKQLLLPNFFSPLFSCHLRCWARLSPTSL